MGVAHGSPVLGWPSLVQGHLGGQSRGRKVGVPPGSLCSLHKIVWLRAPPPFSSGLSCSEKVVLFVFLIYLFSSLIERQFHVLFRSPDDCSHKDGARILELHRVFHAESSDQGLDPSACCCPGSRELEAG